MSGAVQVINALIALMTLADNMGLNFNNVKATFDKAKAEGRDVTADEVNAIASQAAASASAAQDAIDSMPEN